jgi:hypothetical protein
MIGNNTFHEPLTSQLKSEGVMKRIIFTVGLFLCLLFVSSYCTATLVVFNDCEECSSVQVVVTVPATAEDSSYDAEKTLGNWGNSVAFDTPHSGTYMIYANCLLGVSEVTWEFDRSVEIRNVYATKESFLNCSISPTTTTIFPEYYSISGRVTGDIFAGVSMILTGTDYSTLTTDINGYYLFLLLDSGDYTITPAYEGYVFYPQNYVIQSLTDDLSGIDFVSARLQTTPCPSEIIYGEHSEETELLRSIRDNVLSKSQEGRELIKLYYQWSPAIAQAMEADEGFQKEVHELLKTILPLASKQ